MSRPARDFSWHLLALVLVVAGFGVLAPVTWWHVRQASLPSHVRIGMGDEADAAHAAYGDGHAAEAPEFAIAPIGPLVADQIDLDPSITETPALPVESIPASQASETEQPPAEEQPAGPTNELRLSATLVRNTDVRPIDVPLPRPSATDGSRAPSEPPSLGTDNPNDPIPSPNAWAYPAGLIEQLRTLAATTPLAGPWAEAVEQELCRLVALPALDDPAVPGELANLRRMADEAKALAGPLKDDPTRSRILRAGFALVRRLVIWDAVYAVASDQEAAAAPVVDLAAWAAASEKVDALLHATGAAERWRSYLLIDRARAEFDSPAATAAAQRQLARDILHRMHSTQLSRDQEHFLNTPPFDDFGKQLEARAAETPDLAALLRAMETFEHDGDQAANAAALAGQFDVLRWSPDERVGDLADTVNAYYRNTNLRVALSSELVNRLLPQQTPQVEAVEDTILGAWVSGRSQTNTRLRIVLVPDEHRWNIGLEALGEVASNTASSKGPATFHQNGWSMFRARKRLTVDRRGIRLFSAQAEANANNELNDFETDFDGIPLLSGLVRAIARNQYDSSQPAAKVEVEGRIVVRATNQLDREVSQKIEQAKQDAQTKLIQPLRALNLEPTAVAMETTAERLIGRYRVAGREQVSAYTPRPQAPGDSMLSVQIHQSALNNVLENLPLKGRRIELVELYKEMATRFTTRQIEVPDDLPENVYVTFAEHNPVRIDCQDGRVRLTIRLAELSQEGTQHRWTNFTVRAYYEPSADQLKANLKREGIIELIGDERPLPIGQRLTLNGIFARVLSRNRELHIINKQIEESPQLRDQQVTQFVIHDGWIGVALGPQAPGREATMYPRREVERE